MKLNVSWKLKGLGIATSVLSLLISFQVVFAQAPSHELPENTSGQPQGCNGCQRPDVLLVCPKKPIPSVSLSFDVDKDGFFGPGDRLLIARYLERNGPGDASGQAEDANNDGLIDQKDLNDFDNITTILENEGLEFPDLCGICGGDNSSCLDCEGVPKGDSKPDACGVCNGNGPGECGCDLAIKKDCAGECNGDAQLDACGVCNGNGPGECGCDLDIKKDCKGQCGGPAKLDACNVCEGPGIGECGCDLSIKKDCAGVCGGTAQLDSCGVCGGNGPGECGCDLTKKKDCEGVCGGSIGVDACGICNGSGPGECGCDLTKKKDCAGVCGGTAQPDTCGVCNGNGPGECGCDLTEKKDCAGTCGGSAIIDECGICGGNGSTCATDECKFYEVNVTYEGDFGQAQTLFARNEDTPECLNQIFARAEQACEKLKNPCGTTISLCHMLMSTIRMRASYDDCVVGGFILGNEALFSDRWNAYFDAERMQLGGPGWFYWVRKTLKDAGINQGNLPIRPATVGNQKCENLALPGFEGQQICYYREGTIYLDENCQSLDSAPPGVVACPAGTFSWRASPISLEWTNESHIDEQISVVEFGLNPTDDKKYYLWKASSSTPLLVFDPEHTGNITSATQLFGEWSFGGQPLAALSGSTMNKPVPWENGFEALQTLDKNGDSLLTGTELEPIALWFDVNQDGKSQPQEVVSAADAGLTMLQTKGTEVDAKTGDVFVANGFSRVVNGNTVSGRSVDWYGEGSNSKTELLNKYLLKNEVCSKGEALSEKVQTENSKEDAFPVSELATASRAQVDLTGAWNYQAVGEDSVAASTKGILVFKFTSDSTFTGHSVFETMADKKKAGFNSVIKTLPIEGKVVSENGDEYLIEFTVASETGVKIVNTARLSKGVLEGQSKASVTLGGRSTMIPYSWTAKKR